MITALDAPAPAQHNEPFLDSFRLPFELEASEPPEARGLERDAVRLMVSFLESDQIRHLRFRDLAGVLDPGDLLVINTSGTMNASLPATRADGSGIELHLSTRLPGNLWTVEVREPAGASTGPLFAMERGENLQLPAGGHATLHTPYDCGCGRPASGPARLWVATLHLPDQLLAYLAQYGSPIRYGYVREEWPAQYYQSVFATEMGSAEMPSAGRAFSESLITRLVAAGIELVPLLLHTGVASLESHEPPYEETYRVPLDTARRINAARGAGHRIIAVGTTVVRALETVTDTAGATHPGEGWTCHVVSPATGIRSVDGLLTGLHEPRSSHLLLLEALAGRTHLDITYSEALNQQYLWHEFGDLHVILP
jgi:S-adenosylmethionine:tRNA ribosyltransferase-isomerase